MSEATDNYEMFLEVATAAISAHSDDRSLQSIGLSEVLSQPEFDSDSWTAILAFFEAQGRSLGVTSALSLVVAQLLRAQHELPFDASNDAIGMVLPGSRSIAMFPPHDAAHVLFDRPGEGLCRARVASSSVDRSIEPSIAIVETVDSGEVVVPDATWDATRDSYLATVRTLVSFEILGAMSSMMTLAVEHARERTQFGRPIGSFQAIQHTLAYAQTDTVSLQTLCMAGLDVGWSIAPDARWARVLKAHAGVVATRVSQHTLQVLGAIGFTWEHNHHRLQRRVLGLDSMFGDSQTLLGEIGRSARQDRNVQQIVELIPSQ